MHMRKLARVEVPLERPDEFVVLTVSSFGIDCLRVSPARRVPTLLSSERPLVGLWSRSRETIGCSHRRNGRGICLFFFLFFFYLFLPSSLVASGVMSCLRLCFRVCVGGGEREGGGLFSLVSLVSLCPFSLPCS